jgi:hypothetical protein
MLRSRSKFLCAFLAVVVMTAMARRIVNYPASLSPTAPQVLPGSNDSAGASGDAAAPPLSGPINGTQVACKASASEEPYDIEDISVNLPSDWQVLSVAAASVRAFALLPKGTSYEDAICTVQVIWIPAPPTLDLGSGIVVLRATEYAAPRNAGEGCVSARVGR